VQASNTVEVPPTTNGEYIPYEVSCPEGYEVTGGGNQIQINDSGTYINLDVRYSAPTENDGK
jgi:hypothetical protein